MAGDGHHSQAGYSLDVPVCDRDAVGRTDAPWSSNTYHRLTSLVRVTLIADEVPWMKRGDTESFARRVYRRHVERALKWQSYTTPVATQSDRRI